MSKSKIIYPDFPEKEYKKSSFKDIYKDNIKSESNKENISSSKEERNSIGICAPSAGVGHKLESFDLSTKRLKEFTQCEIVETESVRVNASPSATPLARGSELNSLLANPNIKMVIAATGGDFNYDMLRYIDLDLLRNRPIWFAGYSDPTCITMLITTKLDIATIYGFNAGTFDWPQLHSFQKNALEIIKGNIVKQNSYKFFDDAVTYSGEYKMTKPVRTELFNCSKDTISAKSSIHFRGRLIGGCTEVIDTISGTPFQDIIGFMKRHNDEGFIWYFDTFNLDHIELYIKICKMRDMGYFDSTNLIIFGRVMFKKGSKDTEYISLIKKAIDVIPFIWGADIGHTKPSMTLINGSIGEILYKDGKMTLSMELS